MDSEGRQPRYGFSPGTTLASAGPLAFLVNSSSDRDTAQVTCRIGSCRWLRAPGWWVRVAAARASCFLCAEGGPAAAELATRQVRRLGDGRPVPRLSVETGTRF